MEKKNIVFFDTPEVLYCRKCKLFIFTDMKGIKDGDKIEINCYEKLIIDNMKIGDKPLHGICKHIREVIKEDLFDLLNNIKGLHKNL
ncbi:MAG: hypothetical protein ACTSPI_07650 [Candidatus Heimdallarchaeaceae archaeon]